MWVNGEIIRDLDDAEAKARGALNRTTQAALFDRLDWFRRVWRHCPPEDKPLIVRARTDGSDAWLFLADRGGAAVGLASWYTLAFRPVMTGSPSEPVARALLVAIARRLRPRFATIGFDHVPAADADTLSAAFRRAGWIARVAPQTANWSIDVAGKSFAELGRTSGPAPLDRESQGRKSSDGICDRRPLRRRRVGRIREHLR